MAKIFAKKHFGQNFLQDERVLDAIIQAIPDFVVKNKIPLVEIGAGLGDLTNRLLSLGNITAYEVDGDLLPHLRARFVCELQSERLKLINADVMDIDRLFLSEYFLVANLPYYIATALVVRALRDPLCLGFLVMTQLEVAQKFCAKAGEREFGALSVLAASVAKCEIKIIVPPSAFNPAPKVQSAVFLAEFLKQNEFLDSIKLDSIESKNENDTLPPLRDFTPLEKILKIAFLAPRKTILNNFAKSYGKELAEQILQSANIHLNARPSDLDVPCYHRLLKICEVENARRKSTK